MFHDTPAKRLQKRWKFIALIAVIVGLLIVLVSFVFPLEYRADAEVLIISKSRYGVDPYTVVKSAERVGENLSQVIESDDFFSKVQAKSSGVDWSFITSLPRRDAREAWEDTIDPSVVFGTGVLRVSAYHEDPNQARRIANAATTALVSEGWQYVGGDVNLKIVNEPVVSEYPARPNVVLNGLLGLLAGLLLAAAVVVRR